MHELLAIALAEIRGALRFRWYGLAAAWLVCVLGWAVAVWLPDVYEANAKIYVDTSSDLEPLLRDQLVRSDMQDELAYVRESLLSTATLESLVATFELDAKARTPAERQRVLTRLRNDIDIYTESSLLQNNIYVIRYRNAKRDKAIGVVSTLYDGLIEGTLSASLAGTDSAESFVEAQIAEYERELREAEQALADFKRENSDLLPGASGDFFTRRQAARDALRDQRNELQVLRSRRDSLLRQLNGEVPLVASAGLASVEPAPNSIDARIRSVQAELDSMLLVLTERNPEVIAKGEQLALLEAERDRQLAQLGVEGGQELTGLGSNPVFAALQISLNETDAEISALETAIAQQEADVAELQDQIDKVPQIEAQLAAMNRDYDVIYERYIALVRDRETQELSRKANLADQVEFHPLNPPDALLTPVAPERPLWIVAVFGVSILLGAGLCLVLSKAFPVFGHARALQLQLELPVLGTVTQAWEATFNRKRLRAIVAYSACVAALCFAFLALIGFEIVGPGIHTLLDTGAA